MAAASRAFQAVAHASALARNAASSSGVPVVAVSPAGAGQAASNSESAATAVSIRIRMDILDWNWKKFVGGDRPSNVPSGTWGGRGEAWDAAVRRPVSGSVFSDIPATYALANTRDRRSRLGDINQLWPRFVQSPSPARFVVITIGVLDVAECAA